MKKFLCFMFVLIATLTFPLGGCYSQSSTQSSTFTLSSEKPWKNYREKLTYKYEQTMPDGEILESGIYVVEISTSGDTTEIKSTLKIKGTTDNENYEAMNSFVSMDSVSLYPSYSQKTICNQTGKNEYEIIMNYSERTSSFLSGSDANDKQTLGVPQLGQDTFDNEQFYWIIRCANNLTETDNSGTFYMINGVDSFLNDSLKTYTMRYTVGDSTNIACPELASRFGVNPDGRIPCKTVSGEISSNRTGSKTTLYYAINAFENGGEKVLIKFERPKYSLSTLKVESNSVFTLIDYAAV